MRRPLLALSLGLFSHLALAQDSQPTSEPGTPTSIPVEIPVSAPTVTSPKDLPPAPNMSFRREIRNTSGMSINLIGLQNSFDINWSKKLLKSTSAVLDGAHISFGLNNSTSPAYTRVGAWVEIAPTSLLDVRVGVEPTAYFGSFSTLINFVDYNAAYSEDAIAAIDDQSTSGFAGRAYVSPTFHIAQKVGPGRVILADFADIEFWKLFTTDAAPNFFYESARDTLVQSSGDVVINGGNVLLYEYKINEAAGRTLVAGLNHEYLVLPGGDNENTRQTLGLLAVFNVSKHMGSLYKPTIIAKVHNYVQDREDLEKFHEFGAQFAFRFYIGEPR